MSSEPEKTNWTACFGDGSYVGSYFGIESICIYVHHIHCFSREREIREHQIPYDLNQICYNLNQDKTQNP